ncbi:hypothetical protein [Bacillus sp. E214]|uniref:hypothetical protein n=1 Tax=Bacillus sp. E214 TaxID=2587156 RepID=UPI0016528C55|nr:hypothetical protein [Bacillus sp. E214]
MRNVRICALDILDGLIYEHHFRLITIDRVMHTQLNGRGMLYSRLFNWLYLFFFRDDKG